MRNEAIILLSGGLDSVVSLAVASEQYSIDLAISFNYGQAAWNKEYNAASAIAEYYNISHKVVELDWLKDLKSVVAPQLSELDLSKKNLMTKTSAQVWIPNRNAVFINIAAAFADTDEKNYRYIIIGANKEEAATFTDNSSNFIDAINKSLIFSTNSKVQVLAPLIEKNKAEIVKLGVEKNIPFETINSCYNNTEKHCGKCESCLRLRRAISCLDENKKFELLKKLF